MLPTVFAVCLVLQAPDNPGMTWVRSIEGRFGIWLPGKPRETTKDVATPDGPVQARVFLVEPNPRCAFAVLYFDLPGSLSDPDPERVLSGGRDGLGKAPGFKLLDSRWIKKDGLPGLAVQFEITARDPSGGARKAINRTRLYLAGRRLYEVSIVSEGNYLSEEHADSFFDTLRITPGAEPAGRDRPPVGGGRSARVPVGPSPSPPPSSSAGRTNRPARRTFPRHALT